MRLKNLFISGALVTVLAGSALAFWTWRSNTEAVAAQVELRQEGVVVELLRGDGALQAASTKVGFEVRPLGNLPLSVSLAAVDAHLGPEGHPSPLRFADLIYGDSSGRKRITLTEFNVRMTHPANDSGERLDLGIPDVEVWFIQAGPGEVYTIFVGDRTYHLAISTELKADRGLVTRLVATLK